MTDITDRDRYRGALLGGAVGDAMGAGIEFSTLRKIHEQYGPRGVTGYVSAYGRLGAITDDTQMTLFTAEGLLRAELDGYIPGMIWDSYQRWHSTQSFGAYPSAAVKRNKKNKKRWDWNLKPVKVNAPGWLASHAFLHSRRAPGATCMTALRRGRMGTTAHSLNDSKGCGGVMRVAPCAFGPTPFKTACIAAAMTHGHPEGYLAAGAYAHILSELALGATLESAIHSAVTVLTATVDGDTVLYPLMHAIRLADDGPSASAIELIGGGWTAAEALAIGVYCALTADGSFEDGVLLAVNHSGDSDSTGSIAGGILGTLLGVNAIDAGWLARLEGYDVIQQVADDLFSTFAVGDVPARERYAR
jgi:ADP-ribosylglycohydrolase